jgi:hypothetical protein
MTTSPDGPKTRQSHLDLPRFVSTTSNIVRLVNVCNKKVQCNISLQVGPFANSGDFSGEILFLSGRGTGGQRKKIRIRPDEGRLNEFL